MQNEHDEQGEFFLSKTVLLTTSLHTSLWLRPDIYLGMSALPLSTRLSADFASSVKRAAGAPLARCANNWRAAAVRESSSTSMQRSIRKRSGVIDHRASCWVLNSVCRRCRTSRDGLSAMAFWQALKATSPSPSNSLVAF